APRSTSSWRRAVTGPAVPKSISATNAPITSSPRAHRVSPVASRSSCVMASSSAEVGRGSPSGTGRGGQRGRRSVAAPRGRGYGKDKDPRSSQRVQGAQTVMATTTGGFSVPEAAPALRRLRDQVRGQVLEPGTPGYDEA